MRTNIPFAIISAERPEYTAEVNEWRSRSLCSQLAARDLYPVPLDGRYQGRAERSYLVFLPTGDAGYMYRTGLPSLARRWGQSSWLYVDANRFASLNYLDGRPSDHLGIWQSERADIAKRQEAFSYSPLTGEYYTVRQAS